MGIEQKETTDNGSEFTGFEDCGYIPTANCAINEPQRSDDGIEVITRYGFEVDSKGNIKPSFSGEIHRKFPLSTLLFAGKEYPQEMIKKDAAFLVNFAQEILNQTPKIEEKK